MAKTTQHRPDKDRLVRTLKPTDPEHEYYCKGWGEQLQWRKYPNPQEWYEYTTRCDKDHPHQYEINVTESGKQLRRPLVCSRIATRDQCLDSLIRKTELLKTDYLEHEDFQAWFDGEIKRLKQVKMNVIFPFDDVVEVPG